MNPRDDGKEVLYSDHLAIVSELERRLGKAIGLIRRVYDIAEPFDMTKGDGDIPDNPLETIQLILSAYRAAKESDRPAVVGGGGEMGLCKAHGVAWPCSVCGDGT